MLVLEDARPRQPAACELAAVARSPGTGLDGGRLSPDRLPRRWPRMPSRRCKAGARGMPGSMPRDRRLRQRATARARSRTTRSRPWPPSARIGRPRVPCARLEHQAYDRPPGRRRGSTVEAIVCLLAIRGRGGAADRSRPGAHPDAGLRPGLRAAHAARETRPMRRRTCPTASASAGRTQPWLSLVSEGEPLAPRRSFAGNELNKGR